MKENDLIKLGFKLIKTYGHDQYNTKKFKKGFIELELTFVTATQKLENMDVTIEDINMLEIDITELIALDLILNKNK